MSSILITPPIIDPLTVIVDQSDTIEGVRTEAASFVFADLTTDPVTGKLLLDDAAIDTTKHRWISYVSALGVEGPAAYLAPVVATTVATLSLNLAFWDSLGVQPKEGASLSVVPVSKPVKDGAKIGTSGPWTATTDASGNASLSLPLGIAVKVTLNEAGIYQTEITETIAVMDLIDYI